MMSILESINQFCNKFKGTLFQPPAELVRGFSTVAAHYFRPSVTAQYPEVKPNIPIRFHGRLALLVNEDGSDICIGCKACARVCPCDDLIQIEMHREEKLPVIDQFTIDLGRCIVCGNCTEVCPVECLVNTDRFEIADYTREALVYDKAKLSITPDETREYLETHGHEMSVLPKKWGSKTDG